MREIMGSRVENAVADGDRVLAALADGRVFFMSSATDVETGDMGSLLEIVGEDAEDVRTALRFVSDDKERRDR